MSMNSRINLNSITRRIVRHVSRPTPIATLLVLFASALPAAHPGALLRTFADPSQQSNTGFGSAVAIAGENLLVGAPREEGSGAAYLINRRTGATYRKIENPTPLDLDLFGLAVATVDDKLVIGAPGFYSGAVYIFKESTGALLVRLLNPTPPTEPAPLGEKFGFSVAGVGHNILVGEPLDSADVGYAGSAHLFDGFTGTRLLTIKNPTSSHASIFGAAVAAVGSNLLVGAPLESAGDYEAGAAYLFDGVTGNLLLALHNPSPGHSDNFGRCVAAVGPNILVGAPLDDTGEENSGSAYLFDGVTGALLLTLNNPDASVQATFGYAATAVGKNILIGAPRAFTFGSPGPGSAYIFDGHTGQLLLSLTPGPAQAAYFGASLAAHGDEFFVGAPDSRLVLDYKGVPAAPAPPPPPHHTPRPRAVRRGAR